MTTAAPDDRAVTHLYRDHHVWLRQWLRRRLACSHSAADLAHDTFIRILKAGTPSQLHEPRAYLTTIAKGVLFNWYRRQALEQAYLDALAAQPEELAPSEEERQLILCALDELDALLDQLPAAVKRSFLLAQVMEMNYEDIAKELGLSLPTIKRYMKQAFRHCLENFERIDGHRR